MTVSYTLQVATCTGVGCFWRLLFRWRGSIWKLLWQNLVAYIVLVTFISVIYNHVLGDNSKMYFDKFARSCKRDKDLIPMAFILGFYVGLVITRWWNQYVKMPWPDNMAVFINTLIHGHDDRGRLMRRTLIRYCNLSLVITLRVMSPSMKRRFPTNAHLVDAGLLQPNEKVIMDHLDQKTKHSKYWMPLVWAGGVVVRARKEGRIRDDFSMNTIVHALADFRLGCGSMLDYDWICIPLVYTQVVTLAVYCFIATSIIASQAKINAEGPFHMRFPIFSFMQFFFYMGWLKVAESLVNPWGDDDDDFEINWLVDRNLKISYLIVDEMYQEHPEMLKDQFWDDVYPIELPYTMVSKQFNNGPAPGDNFKKDELLYQRKQHRASSGLSSSTIGSNDTGNEANGGYIPQTKSSYRSRKHSQSTSKSKHLHPSIRDRKSTGRYQQGSQTLDTSNSFEISSQSMSPSSDELLKRQSSLEDDELTQESGSSIFGAQIHRRRSERDEWEQAIHYPKRSEGGLATHTTDLKPVDLSAPDDEDEMEVQPLCADAGWMRSYHSVAGGKRTTNLMESPSKASKKDGKVTFGATESRSRNAPPTSPSATDAATGRSASAAEGGRVDEDTSGGSEKPRDPKSDQDGPSSASSS